MLPRTCGVLVAFFFVVCAAAVGLLSDAAAGGKTMELTSSAFQDGGKIPKKYTCDGADVSPSLAWSNVPEGTRTFALICDDPDAPMGTWVHWVMFNIPAEAQGLPEKIPTQKVLADDAAHGINDFRTLGYGGPCPPSGTHLYYFRLYALDTALMLEPGATKAQVIEAMKGHILAEGQLMGTYRR